MNKRLGIYVHVPFCRSKCAYCDFCSFTGCDSDIISRYAAAAAEQIRSWGKRCGEYDVDTVYFGGGTPTLLSPDDFELLLGTLRGSFNILSDAEISSECNPATADTDYLAALRALGINRLSIGAQSTVEAELRRLGRIHTREDLFRTVKNARRAGFENINADIIWGIPGQTKESFRLTVKDILSLSPEHVSAYCLKIEEGTPLGQEGNIPDLPDDDLTAEIYCEGVKLLEAGGLARYEISNFAAVGYECRHNHKYWSCDEYIGIGLAAHSYFGRERFGGVRCLEDYFAGEYIDSSSRVTLDSSECECEFVMLKMRTAAGLCAAEYRERFGGDLFAKYDGRLAEYIGRGLVMRDVRGYRFATEGMLLSSYILSDILDF